MYIKNKLGPCTNHCGTPLKTDFQFENSPSTTTLCLISVSHCYILFIIMIPKSLGLNLSNSLWCGTLSNDFRTCFLNLFKKNKGMVFGYFHSNGTAPSCSDMLNTCASGVLICCKVFSPVFPVLSHVYLVTCYVSYYCRILLAISSMVTTNCPNMFPQIHWTLFLVQVTNYYLLSWTLKWSAYLIPQPLQMPVLL